MAICPSDKRNIENRASTLILLLDRKPCSQAGGIPSILHLYELGTVMRKPFPRLLAFIQGGQEAPFGAS